MMTIETEGRPQTRCYGEREKGLAEAYTGPSTGKITDRGFSYSAPRRDGYVRIHAVLGWLLSCLGDLLAERSAKHLEAEPERTAQLDRHAGWGMLHERGFSVERLESGDRWVERLSDRNALKIRGYWDAQPMASGNSYRCA